jgi:hydroxypyruvate reductase
MATTMDLRAIYLAALERCDPAALVAARAASRPDVLRRPVIALGKCAARMAGGLARAGWSGRGIAVVPAGYESSEPIAGIDVLLGSHPHVDDASFRAGERVLAFAAAIGEPALVLLSGGASAAIEAPLDTRIAPGDIAAINELLVRSGRPIGQINVARKHLSAIKGGRLALRLAGESETWILSDVPPGRPDLVGSGPTAADRSTSADAAAILEGLGSDAALRVARLLRNGTLPDTPTIVDHRIEVLADNRTFVGSAATIAAAGEPRAHTVISIDDQLDDDVETVAIALADVIARLDPGAVAIAGGEPTVVVGGTGRGGRCSELALRLLRLAATRALPPFAALIGSSDGRDGNSGAAAYLVEWEGTPRAALPEIEAALAASDAHRLAARLGTAIVLPPTGNNLRDIMMMARR